MSYDIGMITDAVLKGEANKVRFLVEMAYNKGIDPKFIIHEGLLSPLVLLGEKLKNSEVYIAEVLVVSRAVHAGLHVLNPYMEKGAIGDRGTFLIGTVAGDLHDIGKNLVATTLTSFGWKVIDLGVDVYPEDFVEAVQEYKPDYLGISAMLTTTLNEVGNILNALEEAGLRHSVKVVIGGNPITQDFCRTVGADGTCREISELEDMLAYLDKKIKLKK